MYDDVSNRVVHLRAGTLLLARRDMILLTGEKVARQLLFRLGISLGRTSLEGFEGKDAHEEDFWSYIENLFQMNGWGHILDHKNGGSEDKLSFSITLEDSALAEGGTAEDIAPVCDLFRGILTGQLSRFFDRRILDASESQCLVSGAGCCEFVINLGITLEDAYASGT